ncbi:unnamed protein product [Gordionus sp. m RMFG-2023]|uniref:uncharacterized protein LOC135927565 n=1 Tax=Gordionus sp. m RMFG-2023 TaxID=3053472 RepID=UPI0030E12866
MCSTHAHCNAFNSCLYDDPVTPMNPMIHHNYSLVNLLASANNPRNANHNDGDVYDYAYRNKYFTVHSLSMFLMANGSTNYQTYGNPKPPRKPVSNNLKTLFETRSDNKQPAFVNNDISVVTDDHILNSVTSGKSIISPNSRFRVKPIPVKCTDTFKRHNSWKDTIKADIKNIFRNDNNNTTPLTDILNDSQFVNRDTKPNPVPPFPDIRTTILLPNSIEPADDGPIKFPVSLPHESDKIDAKENEIVSNFSASNICYRNARPDEIVPICHWRAQEFGYGSHWDYLSTLYKCYPDGWFVAVDPNGQIIGNIFAMNLDDDVAFGGLFSVKKPYRCKGVGGNLWEKRKLFVGHRNLGVNAVESRIEPNKRVGMLVAFKIARYRAIMRAGTLDKIVSSILLHDSDNPILANVTLSIRRPHQNQFDPLNNSLFNMINNYDSKINKVSRTAFITSLIESQGTSTIVATEQGGNGEETLLGFGVLRPRYNGFTIGPLYAKSPLIGKALCLELMSQVPVSSIFDFMIIENCDEDNGSLVSTQGMREIIKDLDLQRECTLYRMYTKGNVVLPLSEVYCITSSEAFLC